MSNREAGRQPHGPVPKPYAFGRRGFLGILGAGLVQLASCAQAPAPSSTQGPLPEATPQPRQWEWNIRYLPGVPKEADTANWRLRIDGLVDNPVELTLDQLRDLPAETHRLRMKCVECWSAPGEFKGVRIDTIAGLVRPQANGTFVRAHAFGNYDDTISVADLQHPRTLFVYEMDGKTLPEEHGYPLRIMAPDKYGYKSVKGIIRLEFTDRMHLGYWEKSGYTTEGNILPGIDHPLDLGGMRLIPGGEITDY